MKVRKLLFAGAAVVAVAGIPTAAMADPYVGTTGGDVLGTTQSRGNTGQVAGTTQSRGAGLPVTGGDIAGMTIVGLAAVGTGTVLVRRSRRTTSSPA
jgi:hypothetical protein